MAILASVLARMPIGAIFIVSGVIELMRCPEPAAPSEKATVLVHNSDRDAEAVQTALRNIAIRTEAKAAGARKNVGSEA